MTKYEELAQNELGQKMLKAQEKSNSVTQHYSKNQIGKDSVIAWNPYKLLEKNPFAVVVAEAYDEMIKRTIPKDAILSTRFENWITSKKNELMVDSRINNDHYFKNQTDFATGEITKNNGADLVEAKMNFLNKCLTSLEKAFTTFLRDKPEDALASKEELKAWQDYYQAQSKKVEQILESGNYSYYDKTDKEGNVIKEGSEEDALAHKARLDELMEQTKANQAEAEARASQNATSQPNYVNEEDVSRIRAMKKV
ncbi:hypothetical protein [Campylobacter helveticus]|uniref:hypothetical protein n=1 Tax=Campylobacter helveticus TaxID=28898 RepID=UPI0011120C17|nr:hypothetical protein [Campylobacter helveticus]TNB61105.1 hypothetical protein FDW43_09225 [Campylobacter helveticus]